MATFKLTDLSTNQIYYLEPVEYSSEWLKPVEIEKEMADGTIKTIRKPKQEDKFLITEEFIKSERYAVLYEIWSKRGNLFEFEDWRGNKAKVQVLALREPTSRDQGIHTVHLTLLVKERL